MSDKNEAPALEVITGWRLEDGVSVYLGPNRTWVERLDEALALAGSDLETELAWAKNPALERVVVDPYTFPVSGGGEPAGRRARETIRAKAGPTVRPDLQREER